MKGITIYDEKNAELVDILKVIGEEALNSKWEISGVECFGEMSNYLHEISDSAQSISGKEFFLIASNLTQIIDGYFKAYFNQENKPWLVIRAVDGTEYDIQSNNKVILKKIKDSFFVVADMPD